ncbi:MAG TPA: rhomboid family intramembrane serine protease [Phycisphaerales bacterium]|nr:rhomboid family intramembrane serine protease [Phycisphaerales bacterium]
MIFPYTVDVPMERRPFANWLLIAGTILGTMMYWGSESYEHIFVLYRGEDFSALQLVGSLIGHANLGHLIGNMVALFVFGNAINAKLGHVLFLLFYAAVGVIEGLVWLAVGTGPATLGASGAIMGVIGAFLVMYPRNDISVFYWFTLMYAGSFEISAYWVILCYVGLDIWGLVTSGNGAVNYIAHVAGAAAGFAIMWGLLATRVITSDSDEMSLPEILKENSRSKKPTSGKRHVAGGRKSSAGASEDWMNFPAPSDAPPSPPSPPSASTGHAPRPAKGPRASGRG